MRILSLIWLQCLLTFSTYPLAAEGPRLVLDIDVAGDGSDPVEFTTLGDRVFFVADDDVHGDELWQSDGTPEGTSLYFDLWPGSDRSQPRDLVSNGELLFFSATDGVKGRELWSSDGTVSGLRRRGDTWPGVGGSDPSLLTPSPDGARLYLAAWREDTWEEPFVLDLETELFADGFESGDTSGWSDVVP